VGELTSALIGLLPPAKVTGNNSAFASVRPPDVCLRRRYALLTVKNHLKSILSKFNADDRTYALMIALKRGCIEV
jgi:hypothetical protein